MQRAIFASRDIQEKMKLLKKRKISVYSFFPIDKGDCECAEMIREWKDKLVLMKPKDREAELEKREFITCPKDKTGMTKYRINCKNCGEVQGFCYASDASLSDFFDFHYTNWTDGERWFGCFTPNISPIDQKLGIECTCGQDTRDFRANMTLSAKRSFEMERKNAIGRNFDDQKSKYHVVAVHN